MSARTPGSARRRPFSWKGRREAP